MADSSTMTITQPLPASLGSYPRNHRRSRTANNFFSEERTQGAFSALPTLPRRNLARGDRRPPTPAFIVGASSSSESPSPEPERENMLGLNVQDEPPPSSSTAADSSSVPFPSSGPLSPTPSAPPARPAPPLLAPQPRRPASTSRTVDASQVPARAPSASPTPPQSPITLKNGRPLKPSLKSRSQSTPHLGSLPNHTRAVSAPATPNTYTPKNVHFAGEKDGLESVVLFLREQRPAAVSNGTPEELEPEVESDASGGVGKGYPFPRMETASPPRDNVKLDPARTSPVPNPGTLSVRNDRARNPVMLESLLLPATRPLVLRGTVLVRNVAFHKHVAVRFTLDDWQTVSEVSALYVNHLPSLPPPFGPHSPFAPLEETGWDRFGFQMRLEDYERKIEEKTLFMVVRYNSEGNEWWDNNGGSNYRVRFLRSAQASDNPSTAPTGTGAIPTSPSPPPPPPPAAAGAPLAPFAADFSPPPKRSASFGQLNLKLLNYAPPTSPPQAPLQSRNLSAMARDLLVRDAKRQEEEEQEEQARLMGGSKLAKAAAVEKMSGGVATKPELNVRPAKAERDKADATVSVVLPPSEPTTPVGPPPAAKEIPAAVPKKKASPVSSSDEGKRGRQPARAIEMDYPALGPVDPPKKGKLFTVDPMTPPSSSEASPTHSGTSSPVMTPGPGPSRLDRSERSYEEFLQKYCFFRGPNDPPPPAAAAAPRGLGVKS